jgi:hypothetical protein
MKAVVGVKRPPPTIHQAGQFVSRAGPPGHWQRQLDGAAEGITADCHDAFPH